MSQAMLIVGSADLSGRLKREAPSKIGRIQKDNSYRRTRGRGRKLGSVSSSREERRLRAGPLKGEGGIESMQGKSGPAGKG